MNPLNMIIGTGFIVGDSLVATNRHVVEEFSKYRSKSSPENDFTVVAIFFTKTEGGLGACFLNVFEVVSLSAFSTSEYFYGTSPPDLALVSLSCRGLEDFALHCEDKAVPAGTEIATAGYPLGSELLFPSGTIERFGPVLQRGIISAESPFFDTNPQSYLIDVMVQPGASGSPVFRPESGHVVGVVYALQREIADGSDNIRYQLSTSFSYVIPSTILCKFLAKASRELLAHLPRRLPSISDIVDSMPKSPVNDVTHKVHRFE